MLWLIRMVRLLSGTTTIQILLHVILCLQMANL
nr:MAG TPA: hypothetical protein [Bacteriophage sp.]